MPMHNMVSENPKLIKPTIVPKPANGTDPSIQTIDMPKIVKREPKLRNKPKVDTQTRGLDECEKMLLIAC